MNSTVATTKIDPALFGRFLLPGFGKDALHLLQDSAPSELSAPQLLHFKVLASHTSRSVVSKIFSKGCETLSQWEMSGCQEPCFVSSCSLAAQVRDLPPSRAVRS
jgi:hypothetical protein